MSFSVSERDFLYQSLTGAKPTRPDGREPAQFRGVEASVGFLPNSNGSARIRLSDGSEAIVSVKTKVVKFTGQDDLIEIDFNLDNLRDDLVFVHDWTRVLKDALLTSFQGDFSAIKLTTKYYFKLFIDVLYLSGNSSRARSQDAFLQNPLSMISFATYLALKSTRLPLLVSNADDREIEELPTFDDDWDAAVPLYKESSPPLLFLVAVAKNNLFLDPSIEEQEVSDCGVLVGWCDGRVIAPVEAVNLSQSGNTQYFKGTRPANVIQSVKLVESVAEKVALSLETVIGDGYLELIF